MATADLDTNVYKSARNIDQVTVSPVSGLNALNLWLHRRVLMTKAALDAVRARSAQDQEGSVAMATGSTPTEVTTFSLV